MYRSECVTCIFAQYFVIVKEFWKESPLLGMDFFIVIHVFSSRRREPYEDFAWPIDQTVLLCVDRVVACAEEEERVEDQTTTSANET